GQTADPREFGRERIAPKIFCRLSQRPINGEERIEKPGSRSGDVNKIAEHSRQTGQQVHPTVAFSLWERNSIQTQGEIRGDREPDREILLAAINASTHGPQSPSTGHFGG